MSERFGPYRFSLTKDEFMRYAHEVGRRQLVQLDAKSWRLTIFAGLAVLAVLSGLAVSGVSDPSTLTSGALACAGAILIGKFMIRRQIARAQTIAIDDLARREDVFGRPVTLIVDDAGLSIEMAGADDLRAFAELREAGRLPGLLVFWSGPNDGVALPERALADPAEGEALLRFVRARMTPQSAAQSAAR